jgi:hypothetical protein
MKNEFLKWARVVVVPVLLAVSISSCKDDDEPQTVPQVTTSEITDPTATTATAGGEITDDGGSGISEKGVVYSTTNDVPTITDTKLEATGSSDEFTVPLTGLTPSSTYYVRAYATNKKGTGYGDVVELSTGNAAPTALNVAIGGTVEVNKELTATYTYSDAEGNGESGTTIQWYVADDAAGTNEEAVAGATSLTFTPLDIHEFKYVTVGITAKASSGTTTGTEVKATRSGPIAVRTTVTFTYRGSEVTYGILTSATTGKKWLDRNLGAANTPSSYDDFANYGDLFQWGRPDDGHQVLTWTSTTNRTGTPTTTTLSTTDTPGHSNWILSPDFEPYDWRTPTNFELWQGVNGKNNPCPAGWRIPTMTDWANENISSIQDGYAKLKLTQGGTRSGEFDFFCCAFTGHYWSSEWYTENTIYNKTWSFGIDEAYENSAIRSGGNSCRCIKD